MNKTQWCRDYGGTKGLTCGYWSSSGARLDRHVMRYHLHDEDVFDVERDPSKAWR